MYKVIRRFRDGQDNNFAYEVGDSYPRFGAEVSDERINELLGRNNSIGVPLISGKPPKPTEKTEEKKKGESPTNTSKTKGKAKKRSKKDVGTNS